MTSSSCRKKLLSTLRHPSFPLANAVSNNSLSISLLYARWNLFIFGCFPTFKSFFHLLNRLLDANEVASENTSLCVLLNSSQICSLLQQFLPNLKDANIKFFFLCEWRVEAVFHAINFFIHYMYRYLFYRAIRGAETTETRAPTGDWGSPKGEEGGSGRN